MADDEPDEQCDPRDQGPLLKDPRTMPARFHHLRAASLSSRHAFHAFQDRDTGSLSQRLGAGLHAMIFGVRFGQSAPPNTPVWDVFDARTKNGKGYAKRTSGTEAWDGFLSVRRHVAIMSVSEHRRAALMVDALFSYDRIRHMLTAAEAKREQTILWRELGRERRSTPDVRWPGSVIELKSTRSAEPFRFARDATNHCYFEQLADQRAAARTVTGRNAIEAKIVAIETTAPFVAQIYEIDEKDLDDADQRRIAWLERLQIYEMTGWTTGYAAGALPLKPWRPASSLAVPDDDDDDDDSDSDSDKFHASQGVRPPIKG